MLLLPACIASQQAPESLANLRIFYGLKKSVVQLALRGDDVLRKYRWWVSFISFSIGIDPTDDKENILYDICLEPLIDSLDNHDFHVLKLLHPDRACHLHK